MIDNRKSLEHPLAKEFAELSALCNHWPSANRRIDDLVRTLHEHLPSLKEKRDEVAFRKCQSCRHGFG